MSVNSDNTAIIKLSELETSQNKHRIDELSAFFNKIYGGQPAFLVKVPGRVNLIGEHVDYCGYPVFPMAIQQSILLAVRPTNDNILKLSNVNSKYEEYSCDINSISIEISGKDSAPKWHSYFLCGIKGVFDHLTGDAQKHGFQVVLSGNIPPASGLSSSSALVSAAVLATSYCHEFSLNKKRLSSIAAECERYIGTQGGGMDQAIAFLAQEGSAQFIEWNPLRTTAVTLPPNTFFVIANSLATANKAATADFNHRVVECRLGCKILAKKLNIPWRKLRNFAELQNELKVSLEEIITNADQLLPKEIYTRQDVIQELDITSEELNADILTPNTKHLEEFKIRQRTLHVFQESLRVLQFKKIAESTGCTRTLSQLMRESHESLDRQYECSHPSVNEMIAISDGLGVGARITGAGWGGCIVALCDSKDLCKTYIQTLKEKYYSKIPGFDPNDSDNVIFVTAPFNGAEIYL